MCEPIIRYFTYYFYLCLHAFQIERYLTNCSILILVEKPTQNAEQPLQNIKDLKPVSASEARQNPIVDRSIPDVSNWSVEEIAKYLCEKGCIKQAESFKYNVSYMKWCSITVEPSKILFYILFYNPKDFLKINRHHFDLR